VHHLLPRAHGGTHEMSNLALLCAGHHRALHAGLIVIEGSAPGFKVIRVSEVPHVGDPCVDELRPSGPREPITTMAVRDSACIDDVSASGPRERIPSMGVRDPACIDEARCSGRYDDIAADEVPHVGDVRQMATDVEAGLVRLGFRRAEARDAVARAQSRGACTDAESLMRAALRECPRPTS
jgi:hypothetical protein